MYACHMKFYVNATLRVFPISSQVCVHNYAHFNSQWLKSE